MMEMAGVKVALEDARTLVDLLMRVGRAIDLVAAEAIDRALESDADLVGLNIAMRRAILHVLDDPPPGLCELRGALLRQHGPTL